MKSTSWMIGSLVACTAAVGTVAALGKDPIIMTVGGIDVPKSEFEYLYNKNSQQQIEPQSLESYADMFAIYKMKVADAKSQGIDTTENFKKEINQYRRELAQPWLTDSAYLYSLAKESYNRGKEEVEAYHIMMFKTPDSAENKVLYNRLDSIRKVLLAGGDFESLARQYSQDRSAQRNGGNLGYTSVLHFPYSFEVAVYDTPEGKISEIVESPMGYHIIKGGKRRPARGTVHTAHIMKMVNPDADAETWAQAKAEIDSIYNILVVDPSQFENLARTLSDDKSTGRNGGELQWFGPGEMVREYEAKSFELNDGEISEPVKSLYGWHIIKKLGHRGYPSFDEVKDNTISRINNPQDERSKKIREHNIDMLTKRLKAKKNNALIKEMREYIGANGMDSVFFAKYVSPAYADVDLLTVGKKRFTMNDFLGRVRKSPIPDPEAALSSFNSNLNGFLWYELVECEEDRLEKDNAEYRNLINEYRDGSLLYEASVKRVWDKAAKDENGLKAYYDAHSSEYVWKEPHVKGYILQACNDSVAAEVRNRMNELGNADIAKTIKQEFAGKATLDKVLVTRGQNAMVDYLMFGGPKATPSSSIYTVLELVDARLIDAPEEVADVRGLVTSDYQNELESEWVEELKAKYPVVLNRKVLNSLK